MTCNARIALDYTLHDLYSIDREDEPYPILIYDAQPLQKNGLSSSVKFPYHFRLEAGSDTKMTLMAKNLAQRRALLAGNMAVILLDVTLTPRDRVDVDRNFAQLRHDQQPTVGFEANPSCIALREKAFVAVVVPTDPMSHLPHLINPEMHYEILSKRGLARSGLPTPPSTVIDLLIPLDQLNNPTRLQQEIARMTEPVGTHHVPFVVKLPQSIAGLGTLVVLSEVDRARVKTMLSLQLQIMLKQVNTANHHLHSCSLVLQDYILGEEMALSLFVTRKGRPIFVCGCQQRFDEESHWIGGSILYADQPALDLKYYKVVQKVARFLYQKGYYGPAGIDVITDNFGEHRIIDLNARITGTYHLGLLAGHFLQRGMGMATAVSGYLPSSRTAFEQAFGREMQNGSLVIGGWTHDESVQQSCASITIGARKSLEMEKLLAKLYAYAEFPRA